MERRTRLIAAGLELFGAQGYAATSVRAVLRKAGRTHLPGRAGGTRDRT
ncbi:TetR family transcriptional regulator [Streptomyces scopuliridis]